MGCPGRRQLAQPAHVKPGTGPRRERGPHLQQEVGAGVSGLHVPLRQALAVPPACSAILGSGAPPGRGFLLS